MTAPPFSANSKRILVVEDEKPMLDILEITLGNAGFQVVTATEDAEALALAKMIRFDLAIIDLSISGMVGIETISALRVMVPGIKIIATSGGQPGSAEDFLPLAQSLGSSAVLRKPINRESFIATVWECLNPKGY